MTLLRHRVLNDYSLLGKSYAKGTIDNGTGQLVFGQMPSLIKKHNIKKGKCLDFGCGAGRSTRFLKNIGFADIYAVDISKSMIELAKQKDPSGQYQLITDNKIALPDQSLDFIFSSLVFLEITSLYEMKNIFQETKRVLKKNGYFILVTSSIHMYNINLDWLSLDNNYKENELLTSGSKALIKLDTIDEELFSIYWTEEDYTTTAIKAGYYIKDTIYPTGNIEDVVNWRSELYKSPYLILIMQNLL